MKTPQIYLLTWSKLTLIKETSYTYNVDPPTVVKIKKEWSILLKKKAIIWHFKKLTNTRVTEVEIIARCEKILNFVKTRNISNNNSENIILSTIKSSRYTL